jgi:hypothetical protein
MLKRYSHCLWMDSHCREKSLREVMSFLTPSVNGCETIRMVHVVKPLSKYQQFVTLLGFIQGL